MNEHKLQWRFRYRDDSTGKWFYQDTVPLPGPFDDIVIEQVSVCQRPEEING